MCDNHDDEDHAPPRFSLSRRRLLGIGAAAIAGATVADTIWLPTRAMAASGTQDTLTGAAPVRLAMHVHGSWSEGPGSWEAQFDQAARNAIDVLYMTDHDTRQLARHYLQTLHGARWSRASTGKLARQAAGVKGRSIHLVAESASWTKPASVTLTIASARHHLRTSVAGQTLVHTVESASLSHGATYEIVIGLSHHPAAEGRRAGQYELVYRFGPFEQPRHLEVHGLRGVVCLPRPRTGSVHRLHPDRDIAALWPTMHAADNCFYSMDFVARSPKKGAVANVKLEMEFERPRNTPDAVQQEQQAIIATYQPRFPNLSVRRGSEFSRQLPDMTGFGMPQYIPDYSQMPSDAATVYEQIAGTVHQQGGVMSYNHPFGYDGGPLISATDQVAKRRDYYQAMTATNLYGADILEVGYLRRGGCDAATHLDLWDTFSRAGRFLTGSGVSDDHEGQRWDNLLNGFVTGAWTASRSDADVSAALASGRAYLTHMGRWPGGAIDLRVDGAAPMGSAWVGGTTTAGGSSATRTLTVLADALPTGSVVQIVSGPVDASGSIDPGTQVVNALPAANFAGGPVDVPISAPSSCFYRVQVMSSTGTFIGSSNPIWLLDSEPADGVPAARQVG
ncbi:MAG TPA: hypothetical protein VFJ17_05525 [Mycobacteriales bacterium]|nr:hypothetical protein [Mycobacteriales bacterium]